MVFFRLVVKVVVVVEEVGEEVEGVVIVVLFVVLFVLFVGVVVELVVYGVWFLVGECFVGFGDEDEFFVGCVVIFVFFKVSIGCVMVEVYGERCMGFCLGGIFCLVVCR